MVRWGRIRWGLAILLPLLVAAAAAVARSNLLPPRSLHNRRGRRLNSRRKSRSRRAQICCPSYSSLAA